MARMNEVGLLANGRLERLATDMGMSITSHTAFPILEIHAGVCR